MKKTLKCFLSSALVSLTFLVLQINLSQAMDTLDSNTTRSPKRKEPIDDPIITNFSSFVESDEPDRRLNVANGNNQLARRETDQGLRSSSGNSLSRSTSYHGDLSEQDRKKVIEFLHLQRAINVTTTDSKVDIQPYEHTVEWEGESLWTKPNETLHVCTEYTLSQKKHEFKKLRIINSNFDTDIDVPYFGAEVHTRFENASNQSNQEEKTTTIYLLATYDVPSIVVSIGMESIKVKSLWKGQIENVMQLGNTDLEKYNRLINIFNNCGLHVPTKYYLGGYMWNEEKKKVKDQREADKEKETFALAVKAAIEDNRHKITNLSRFAVAVGPEGEGLPDLANPNDHLSLGEETDNDCHSSSNAATSDNATSASARYYSETSNTEIKAGIRHHSNLKKIGGDRDANNIQEWFESLNDSATWSVIRYENFLSIFDILECTDFDLVTRCESLIKQFYNRYERRNSSLEELRNSYRSHFELPGIISIRANLLNIIYPAIQKFKKVGCTYDEVIDALNSITECYQTNLQTILGCTGNDAKLLINECNWATQTLKYATEHSPIGDGLFPWPVRLTASSVSNCIDSKWLDDVRQKLNKIAARMKFDNDNNKPATIIGSI